MKTLWRALVALVMVGGLAAVMGCGGDTTTPAPKKDDAKPATTPEKKA